MKKNIELLKKGVNKMKLNNNVYNILKWVALLFLPAFSALYVGLAGVWGWSYADEVAQTLDYVGAFLGVILGISTLSYNKTMKRY